ncbi:hypothetical protein CEUSTIGMA_g8538.t1 [Chlamydomonas eustigma]|uniref:Photosynthesis system II assembly factor Ycf48/Hcf136-like domain-containing protein n=1 Tax=Chlamydomonas eustigma TaxID=1157962 RepID=A0A250XDD8_9CHLO|nr:hypothetical protein CEUSTIGMA_g8538.t1 [Chlamydomonas eustigma]|eukprot:GAX81104.1 hypothetical protein CEUSTIGMA_g8538.t1 [Chlamydomonas eustigma]
MCLHFFVLVSAVILLTSLPPACGVEEVLSPYAAAPSPSFGCGALYGPAIDGIVPTYDQNGIVNGSRPLCKKCSYDATSVLLTCYCLSQRNIQDLVSYLETTLSPVTDCCFGISVDALTSQLIDSGVSWVQQTNSGRNFWVSITSSSDGSKLAAVVHGGYIYTSSDSGVNWVVPPNSSNRNWQSITSSSDGSKLAAVVTYGYIYTSSDSGVSWVQQTNSGIQRWYSITSSSDGSKLAAVVLYGYIYTSSDSGANWTLQALS